MQSEVGKYNSNIIQLKSLGQSLLSLSTNLGALLAGILLAVYLNVFSFTPWTLILFPGILSMRGAIGGLLSARLSTGLHLGTIKASYTKNTRSFYLLLYAATILAFGSSVVMGLATSLFGIFLWGATIMDSIALLTVITATMGLSILFISPITIAISVLSFRYGLDPDIIIYPTTATLADIVITLCYALVLYAFYWLTPFLMVLLDFFFLSVVIYILFKNIREKEFLDTIKEFFITLVVIAFIVNITGSILHKLSDVISGRKEILMVYPALIDTVGSVGSIVGSTATTKLALGSIESSLSSIKKHLNEVGSVWSASLIMFLIYSLIPSLSKGINLFTKLLVQLVITNLLAVFTIVIIAFVMAIFTFKRGLDPDNFVIPVESSLADSITTISLFLVLILLV